MSIPIKTVRIRPDDKPWYTNQLRQYWRHKDRLHKKAKTSDSPKAWSQYRKIRYEYIRATLKAKHEYDCSKYSKLCENIDLMVANKRNP